MMMWKERKAAVGSFFYEKYFRFLTKFYEIFRLLFFVYFSLHFHLYGIIIIVVQI